MRPTLLLLVVATAALSCRIEPVPTELPLQDYTQGRPSISALVGSYQPDRGSSKWLERHGFRLPPRLQLAEGGRFRFSDVPESVATGWDDLRHNAVVQIVGTWSLKRRSDGWCVAVRGNYQGICFDQLYRLRGATVPYRVHCPVGDRSTGFPFTLRRAV